MEGGLFGLPSISSTSFFRSPKKILPIDETAAAKRDTAQIQKVENEISAQKLAKDFNKAEKAMIVGAVASGTAAVARGLGGVAFVAAVANPFVLPGVAAAFIILAIYAQLKSNNLKFHSFLKMNIEHFTDLHNFIQMAKMVIKEMQEQEIRMSSDGKPNEGQVGKYDFNTASVEALAKYYKSVLLENSPVAVLKMLQELEKNDGKLSPAQAQELVKPETGDSSAPNQEGGISLPSFFKKNQSETESAQEPTTNSVLKKRGSNWTGTIKRAIWSSYYQGNIEKAFQDLMSAATNMKDRFFFFLHLNSELFQQVRSKIMESEDFRKVFKIDPTVKVDISISGQAQELRKKLEEAYADGKNSLQADAQTAQTAQAGSGAGKRVRKTIKKIKKKSS